MLSAMRRFFLPKPDSAIVQRHHLTADTWPDALFVIGDVHGCLSQLLDLEARIVADAAALPSKWIVLLGDYVDRGPDSAAVLDHLVAKQPDGFVRVCLAGNHETMMLAYFDNPSGDDSWLQLGGDQTLLSYGIDADEMRHHATTSARRRQILDAHVPSSHIDFLRALPVTCSVGNVVCVHAGLVPGIPTQQQKEADMLWMRYRPDTDASPDDDRIVVHGHTPTSVPLMLPHRIAIDTGAFATGVLSAVHLDASGNRMLLQTTP